MVAPGEESGTYDSFIELALPKTAEARTEAGKITKEQAGFFDNIRKLQKYIKSLALQHGVPIVPSYNLDATLSQVIDLVVGQAINAFPSNRLFPSKPPFPSTPPFPNVSGKPREAPDEHPARDARAFRPGAQGT